MKSISKLFVLSFFGLLLSSCETDDNDFARAVSIKVVNLIEEEDHVMVKIGDGTINYANILSNSESTAKVAFGDFGNFSFSEREPIRFEVVKESDTLTPIFSEILDIEGIRSLYMVGTSEEMDAVFIEDNPKQFNEDALGIRFINLSKDVSGPLNIKNNTTGAIIASDLVYQSATDFIEFPVNETDGALMLEFEDSTGTISNAAQLSLDPYDEDDPAVRKNLTLVITEIEVGGIFGTTVAYKFTRVNSY